MWPYLMVSSHELVRKIFSDKVALGLNFKFDKFGTRNYREKYWRIIQYNHGLPCNPDDYELSFLKCAKCGFYTRLGRVFNFANLPACLYCAEAFWDEPVRSAMHPLWRLDPKSVISTIETSLGGFYIEIPGDDFSAEKLMAVKTKNAKFV